VTDVEQAKQVYAEKVAASAHARMYVGANHSRMSGELAAEASAAATYIHCLEEAERLRQTEQAHPHRKPGQAQ
jgi:hypothetical protein